jgi:hypothetical protein
MLIAASLLIQGGEPCTKPFAIGQPDPAWKNLAFLIAEK